MTVSASGVLANDSDPDGNSLKATLVTNPAKGTATLNPDGSFIYTPNQDYNGADSFTYKANDGTTDSSAATVTITVNPINDAPVADNQSVTTDEDVAKNITLGATDVDGDTLTYDIVSGPSHGTLSSGTGASRTYTPAADYNGSDSFTFKANDGTTDSNTATVSITVTAVNDAPSFTKGPNQNNVPNQDDNGDPKAYTVDPWATNISPGAPNESSQTLNFVLTNDNNDLFNVQPAVSPSGVLTFTPNPAKQGTVTVTIYLHDDGGTANGGHDTSPSQTFTINTVFPVPDAVDDPAAANAADYAANGGIPIDIPASIGVLQNDAKRGGSIDGYGASTGTEQTSLGTATPTAKGGFVTLSSDGSFRYEPPPSPPSGGTDTFKYRLSNNGGSDTATVTISVTDQAFFVDDSASAGGNGTLLHPFNSPSDVPGTRGNNGLVFLFSGSYSDGITLKSGEYLIGQGVDVGNNLPFALKPRSIALPSKDTNPTLGASTLNANAVTLGSDNNVKGLDLGNTKGGSDISGTNFGTLTIGTVGINTNGQALSLNNGTLSGSGFTQLSSTGGANNVSLTSVGTSGTPALGTSSDALSGASSDAFKINGGGGSFTYAGKISNTSTLAVNVTSKTGGTVTFSGDINPTTAGKGISVSENKTGTNTITFSGANKKISTGSGTGVSLSNNTGATIDFTNGGLAVTGTSNAAGFSATGGGTVTVQSGTNANTISTDTGTALNVANTNIGSSGLIFKSITAGNSSSGPTNGIVLNSTGTSGGLTVTGDGSSARNGSGGTIQHTSGDAISLTSTDKVSLSRMNINNSAANGVRGQSVNGFVLDWASLSGNGNTNAGDGEGGLLFGTTGGANGLTGSAPNGSNPTRISNTNISSSGDHNIAIFNSSGTLTELDLTKTTLTGLGSNPPTGEGGSGFTIETRNSAAATVIATGSTFNNNYSVGAQGSAVGSSNLTFKVLGGTSDGINTFTNNNEGVLCSNGNGSANATCEVSGNTFTGQPGNAIFVGNGNNLNDSATLNGKIQNNTITQPTGGNNNTIESLLSGTGAVSKLLISGNTVTNNGQFDGILVGTPDNGSSPNFSVTVTNNNVTNAASAVDNINLQPHQSSTACFDVRSNTTSGSTTVGINLLSDGNANTKLERGSSTSNDPNTVLAANNPNATANTGGTPTFAGTSRSGTLTVVNNGTCATP